MNVCQFIDDVSNSVCQFPNEPPNLDLGNSLYSVPGEEQLSSLYGTWQCLLS